MRLALIAIVLLAIVILVGQQRGWYAATAPLVEAAEEGDLEKVKALIKQGRSINEHESKSKFGWTPLIAAIYQGNTNVAHYLINAGADPNLGDKNGETPLMWAMARGDENVEIVKVLIAHGADVCATNSNGANALSYATSDPPKPRILEVMKTAESEQKNQKGTP